MNDATKTLNAMKAELEAVGYRWYAGENSSWIDTPDPSKWGYENFDTIDSNESLINIAWQHYQREKKYQAMEALLEEMAMRADVDCSSPENDCDLWNDAVDWMIKAKALLGKE